ncbi:hypothetical protein BGX34_005509 [Mortierella sp. NVP85]|nr:hypothetical protein BGX34_005509 [Mortierella sp. NVP85]
MQMHFTDVRLKSFAQRTRSWPHPLGTYVANPETLADAGFYWKPATTSPDNVVCFLCRKSLDGWNETDDPLDEHLSHSRHCGWAIVKNIPMVEDGLPFRWDEEGELPKGERMTKARLETFGDWWPHERTKGWYGNSRRMANAGFFYAPTDTSADNVQCPYCGLALEGWEASDDPVHEHQRRNPTCPFFATRAAAPTKASAAKMKKRKQKDTAVDPLPSKEQRVHGRIPDHMDTRTNPALDRHRFPTQVESMDKELSSGVLNKDTRGDRSQGSPRSVEFQLPEETVQASARVRKEKASVTKKTDTKKREPSQRRSQRVKIEEDDQITVSLSPDTDSTPVSSVSTHDQPSSTVHKRSHHASEDGLSAPTSRASSASSRSKASNVSVVITKKRKLTDAERAYNRSNWGESFSEDTVAEDMPGDYTDNILDSTSITQESTHSTSSKADMTRQATDTSRSALTDDDESGNTKPQIKGQSVSEPSGSHGNRRKGSSKSSTHVEVLRARASRTDVGHHNKVNYQDTNTEHGQEALRKSLTPVDHNAVQDAQDIVAGHLVDAEHTTTLERESTSTQDVDVINTNETHPATPTRRSTSRSDIEGWGDDDVLESAESGVTSPFVSPSRWASHGSLETSTPKSGETADQPMPGVTSQHHIKDVVGIESPEFPLRSPPAKKSFPLNLMSPEQKQQKLIDRLENLMHGNEASEVMATAKRAFKEEMKLLQRKEHMTTTEAASEMQELTDVTIETQTDGDDVVIESDEGSDSDNSNDILQTPIKKANMPSLLGQITPGTPTNKTPRPISQVISAIGAASRRNIHSPVPPFVRTPVKKAVDLFRLQDLEPLTGASLGKETKDRLSLDPDPALPTSDYSFVETNKLQPSTSTATLNTTTSSLRGSDSIESQQDQDDTPVSFSRHQKERLESNVFKLHKDIDENNRRLGLMEAAGITEREVKMTVEELHRHFMEEEIRSFELQAESWIQRFQEESDRVREALLQRDTDSNGIP